MMISTYTYTDESLTSFANQIKELVVKHLHSEHRLRGGVSEPVERICGEFTVVLAKKGVLGKWFDKFRDRTEDGPYITILKSRLPEEET